MYDSKEPDTKSTIMQLKSGWTVTLGFVPWKVLNSGVDRLEGNLETIKWCDWNVVLPLGSLVDWEIRRSLQVSFFPAHSQILDWWWFGEAPSGEDEKVQVSKAKFTENQWRFLQDFCFNPLSAYLFQSWDSIYFVHNKVRQCSTKRGFLYFENCAISCSVL